MVWKFILPWTSIVSLWINSTRLCALLVFSTLRDSFCRIRLQCAVNFVEQRFCSFFLVMNLAWQLGNNGLEGNLLGLQFVEFVSRNPAKFCCFLELCDLEGLCLELSLTCRLIVSRLSCSWLFFLLAVD